MKEVKREILLAFWKVHILHHAGEAPLHGQWMLDELRHHGHAISPGTLYPLLRRMEHLGWLARVGPKSTAPRARRDYRLTASGAEILTLVRQQLVELCAEVLPGSAAAVSPAAPPPAQSPPTRRPRTRRPVRAARR